MPALILILGIPLTLFGIWCLIYITPHVNKFFALIWQDPSERQRQEIVKRLHEHHVDGTIPEETSVLMAASEFNTTERDLLKAADLLSAADMKALFSGKRTLSGILAGKAFKIVRDNAVHKAKKRKLRPQVDEVPGSVEESVENDGGDHDDGD